MSRHCECSYVSGSTTLPSQLLSFCPAEVGLFSISWPMQFHISNETVCHGSTQESEHYISQWQMWKFIMCSGTIANWFQYGLMMNENGKLEADVLNTSYKPGIILRNCFIYVVFTWWSQQFCNTGIVISFYRWENGSSEGFCDMLPATELVSSTTDFWIQFHLTSMSMHLVLGCAIS